MVILMALIFIYAMTGSIDFGAGFWAMVYLRDEDAQAAVVANRYLSPLWEVTNVFLVLFAVALVGLFPKAALIYGNLLLLPGSLILIFLTLRTVMMVFAHVVNRFRRSLRIVSGITGILIPALLVTVFPLSDGGFITMTSGDWQINFHLLFGSWSVYHFVLLGLFSELFISAVFLSDYARLSGDHEAFLQYRNHALWLGPITVVLAILIPIALPVYAHWILNGIQTFKWWFIISGVVFVLVMYFLFSSTLNKMRNVRWAAITLAFQYLLALWAYGKAHYPYLLYPVLTVQNSFTNPTMFKNVLIVLIIGIAILFPGFVWFWRLFLSRRAFIESE